MTIIVKYVKNLVTGNQKGRRYPEAQTVTTAGQSLILRQMLMEISDLHPAEDPVTGTLCYVTDIEEINSDNQKSA